MYCMKTVVCVSRRHIFALTSATPFISTNYNKNACELSVLHSFHNKRFCNLTCYYLKNSFTRQPHLFLSGTFDLSNLWVNSCTGSVLDYKRYKKADIDGACKPDLTLGNKNYFCSQCSDLFDDLGPDKQTDRQISLKILPTHMPKCLVTVCNLNVIFPCV